MLQLKKKASFQKLSQIYTKSKFLLYCHCNNINTSDWYLIKKELSKQQLLRGVNTLLVKNQIVKSFFSSSLTPLPTSFQGVTLSNQQVAESKSKKSSGKKIGAINVQDRAGVDKSNIVEQLVLLDLKLPSKTEKVEPGIGSAVVSSTLLNVGLRPSICPTSLERGERSSFVVSETCKISAFQGPTLIIGCDELDLVVPLLNLVSKYKKLLVIGGVLEKKVINHLDINFFRKLDKSIFNQLIDVLERPFLNFLLSSQKSSQEMVLLLEQMRHVQQS